MATPNSSWKATPPQNAVLPQNTTPYPYTAPPQNTPPLRAGVEGTPQMLPPSPFPVPPKKRKGYAALLWVSISIAATLSLVFLIGFGALAFRLYTLSSPQLQPLPSDFASVAGSVASPEEFEVALKTVVEKPGFGTCYSAAEVAPVVAEPLQLTGRTSSFSRLLETDKERVHIYICATFNLENPPQDIDEWTGGYLEAIYVEPPTPAKAEYWFQSFSYLLPNSPQAWSVRGENWVFYSLGFTADSRDEAESVFGRKVIETYIID